MSVFQNTAEAGADRLPALARARREGQVVCHNVTDLVRQITAGAAESLSVFVAAVACVVGLYRARDHVRIAVLCPSAGETDRYGGMSRGIVVDLPLAASTRFGELVHFTAEALAGNAAISVDAADAIVNWREADTAPRMTNGTLGCEQAELLFDFSLEAPHLRLAVQTAGAVGHRISPAVVEDVVAEIALCLSEEPTTAIGELRFVSAAWRRKLLVGFNGEPVLHDKDRSILHRFEEWAAKAGSRPALTFGEQTLSYGGLSAKANSLAAQLHSAGVRKSDLIPIVSAGGIELPVAMLALLKLGAAFVPLDAAWPRERQQVILNELGPKLALYSDPAHIAVTTVPSLCFTAAALAGQTDKPAEVDILPDDLIYGFFTSGSTGVPKCTLNLHGGLLNRFQAMSRRFGADGSDIVLQNSKHVFDSSIWQLLWPLTTGSQVVIPRAGSLLDLSYTIELIDHHKITMTDFVPSIFNALVEVLEFDRGSIPRLASLRQLLIGGEEIGAKAVQKFRSLLPGCGITNTYGPTEASIGCIFHEVRNEDGWSIPIGRPIDNCYATIVDARGVIVPPGAVGEILIGGDCLGRGYLNDPAKTRAAFITNTLPEIPGACLYRTGDLGYYRGDGNIHFVGRQDQQVKLGGVRIELTEIETVIAAHSAVRAVKVIVEGQSDPSPRLVAYVVAGGGTGPDDIMSAVASALPGYCVPKQVFMIDRMPLTPNGKVDRKALGAMAHNRETPADDTVSDSQGRIRSIWLELLALKRVGLHDDFFERGGDSLSAVRLSLRLSKELNTKITARDIYRYPTISQQTTFLESGLDGGAAASEVTSDTMLQAAGRLDPAIAADPMAAVDAPRLIFLTGATGFVGSHLLRNILAETSAHVICLVRAANDAAAAMRLRKTMQHYRLQDEGCDERITAVAGDLELPQFGLSERLYDFLACSVDAVVHNGAVVNFLLDYPALRPANVFGTSEIIRFCVRRRLKRLHYISTLSAVASDDRTRSEETELATATDFPAGGYAQSKAVAERLLTQARHRGVAAVIYRLGEVMPHSRSGIANARAQLDTLIRSCLKLGMSFATSLQLDYTPVDYVTRFLTAAIAAPRMPVSVFHVFHPDSQSLETVFASFRNAGFPLRPVSYGTFYQALRQACALNGADPDLLLTLALLPEPVDIDNGSNDGNPGPIVANACQRFSCAHTLAALETLGVAWPTLGERALESYAAYHRRELRRESQVELTVAQSD
jgi:amino acid adenylation domain-containing protein/thioester reductase-like protein